jgi:hypothetical protein
MGQFRTKDFRRRTNVNLCLSDGEILFNQSGSNEFDSGVREVIV